MRDEHVKNAAQDVAEDAAQDVAEDVTQDAAEEDVLGAAEDGAEDVLVVRRHLPAAEPTPRSP